MSATPDTIARRSFLRDLVLATCGVLTGVSGQYLLTRHFRDHHALRIDLNGFDEAEPQTSSVRITNSGNVAESNLAGTVRFRGDETMDPHHTGTTSEPLLQRDAIDVDKYEQTERTNKIYIFSISRLSPGDWASVNFSVSGNVTGIAVGVQSDARSAKAVWPGK